MGEGEGWRREVDCGELVLEEGSMVMWGVFMGGLVERAEEEGRVWRVVVADMVDVGALRAENEGNGLGRASR